MEKLQSNIFIEDDTMAWEIVAPGVKRKIMGYDQHLMVLKIAFESGGVGAVHSHFHTQVTHIESGLFEVEVNGIKKKLRAGDGFFIPPNVPHGIVCLEAGTLIDAFSPLREDFLSRE